VVIQDLVVRVFRVIQVFQGSVDLLVIQDFPVLELVGLAGSQVPRGTQVTRD